MKIAVGLILMGLLMPTTAATVEVGACSVRKGLYDEWTALSSNTGSKRSPSASHLRRSSLDGAQPATQQAIGEEYQAFFQCLSDAMVKTGEAGGQGFCDQAAGDHLAFLVCQAVAYLKTGRTHSKDFIDALPAGKKGPEMIWDLEAIAAAVPGGARAAPIFQPDGPALKLIDELFLLVLDDKDNAAARYFRIAASASGQDARHMDQQIQALLREAPAVVVKEWAVLRQYQPKLKKVLADMAASLPDAELLKMRRGVEGFCTKDNLDCLDILKMFPRTH